MTLLTLKKRNDQRLLAGHDWVFSNEIDTTKTPLKALDPGADVRIESASGKFLAHGYVNPHSLIAARVTSRFKHEPFTVNTLKQRLLRAVAFRESCFSTAHYRLCHSEGDLLPGLTIDRYAHVLIVQITTAGMERFRDEIIEVLASIAGVTSICLRNDTVMRDREHLPSYREWVLGQPAEVLSVSENGLQFEVSTEISQKTGWFYDHRDSRMAIRRWVKNKRVLDLYTYLGAFGINAAAAGASSVLAVDASAKALENAKHNAVINGVGQQLEFQCADAVETLRSLYESGERFDVVVLDPPAFIKKRKDLDPGVRHYALNNRLAQRLLNPEGILLSASCSQALSHDALIQQVQAGVPKRCEGIQLLTNLRQGIDHPVRASMPETLYLTGVIGRLMGN